MSIFGQLDAAAIPSNPFHVGAGEYTAEVTKAEYSTSRAGNRQLHIEYTITSEESEFLDQRLNHYFQLVDADMTEEAFALLSVEDRARIRKTNSKIKQTLCGNDANHSQNGLGVDPDDLNDPNWNPAVLVGTKVDIAVTNGGTNNEYVNIKWVNKSAEQLVTMGRTYTVSEYG